LHDQLRKWHQPHNKYWLVHPFAVWWVQFYSFSKYQDTNTPFDRQTAEEIIMAPTNNPWRQFNGIPNTITCFTLDLLQFTLKLQPDQLYEFKLEILDGKGNICKKHKFTTKQMNPKFGASDFNHNFHMSQNQNQI
jgi:hypothetical protein